MKVQLFFCGVVILSVSNLVDQIKTAEELLVLYFLALCLYV